MQALMLCSALTRAVGLALSRPILRSPAHLPMSASLRSTSSSFPTILETPLQHGMCIVVGLPLQCSDSVCLEDWRDWDAISEELHPHELAHMQVLTPPRQLTFAGGRLAIHRAIRAAQQQQGDACELVKAPRTVRPVMPNIMGAPTLSLDWLGSISHTQGLATAIVREATALSTVPTSAGLPNHALPQQSTRSAVGIDIESTLRRPSLRIARRILSPVERLTLVSSVNSGELGLDESTELLLRFSLKEALYKALHPMLCCTIPWHSVKVRPRADGGCNVDMSELEQQLQLRLRVEAHWQQRDHFFLTTAIAHLEDE